MSVKKEPSGRRSVQAEVEVPGTPEQVWEAIATGPGVSAWFVPTEMRADGSVVAKFGPGMEAVAVATAWDPPRRFAAESRDLGPDAPPLATEWVVEARDGGTCVVRVVHSLFSDADDWDSHLENIEGGWPDYFRILRLYLTHFAGQPCAGMQLMAITHGPAPEAWTQVAGAVGVLNAPAGRPFRSTDAVPPLAGAVEQGGSPGHPHQALLRLDLPTPGIAHLFTMPMGGPTVISIRFYLYGEEAPAAVARDEPRWQSWLQGQFEPQGAPA